MNDKTDWKALESMTAADVMTAAPRTCSTFSTVLEAVMIFRDNDCGAVPILEDGKPVAILTDRDVALAISQFPDLSSQPVSSIMTPGIVSVAAEDRLERVCEVLRVQGVRRSLGRRFGRARQGNHRLGRHRPRPFGPNDGTGRQERRGPGLTPSVMIRSGRSTPPGRPAATQAQDGVHPVEVADEFFRRQGKPQSL